MNKSVFGFLFLTAFSMNAPAFAANRAVEVNINGIGPAVDAAALQTVRLVIGNAISNGLIDKFNVLGHPIEGGLSACVEVSAFNTTGAGLSPFIRQLRSIRPNPATTAYSVKAVASCANEEIVFCTQDAKQCPDGSYVSRIPPSCQFAACP